MTRRIYCYTSHQIQTSPAERNHGPDKCDHCGLSGHPDFRERIDSLSTERRDDGFHIQWHDYLYRGQGATPWHKGPIQGYTHRIIVKGLDEGGTPNRGAEVRFRAFAMTLLSGDNFPKQVQKKWEKIFSEALTPNDLPAEFDGVWEKIQVSIKKHYNTEYARKKDMAKWALERAIKEAHEYFSPEEVDSIVNEAVVGSVLAG